MVCPTRGEEGTVSLVQDTGIGRCSQGQAQRDSMTDAKVKRCQNASISMSMYLMACFDTYTQCVCS